MKRIQRSVLNVICEIEFAMTKVSRFYLQILATRFLQNVRNITCFSLTHIGGSSTKFP